MITPLRLGSPAALAVASFLAVLAYVVSTLLSAAEDLDRPDPAPARPPAGGPLPEAESSEREASENEAPEGAVR